MPKHTYSYTPDRQSLTRVSLEQQLPQVTIGPIIGKVTGNSARVVVETNRTMQVTCTLTADTHTRTHDTQVAADTHTRTRHINAFQGSAFLFTGLSPVTRYIVTFSIPCTQLSAFWTLPTHWSLDAPPPPALLQALHTTSTHAHTHAWGKHAAREEQQLAKAAAVASGNPSLTVADSRGAGGGVETQHTDAAVADASDPTVTLMSVTGRQTTDTAQILPVCDTSASAAVAGASSGIATTSGRPTVPVTGGVSHTYVSDAHTTEPATVTVLPPQAVPQERLVAAAVDAYIHKNTQTAADVTGVSSLAASSATQLPAATLADTTHTLAGSEQQVTHGPPSTVGVLGGGSVAGVSMVGGERVVESRDLAAARVGGGVGVTSVPLQHTTQLAPVLPGPTTIPTYTVTHTRTTTHPTPPIIRHKAPCIAVVSCDSVFITRDDVEKQLDLWGDMCLRCLQGEIDYVFHIGDNIYADSDLFDIQAGKRKYKGMQRDDCAFLAASDLLDQHKQEEWQTYYADVCEIYRQVYRLTWNHPGKRGVLANVPNLMIMDDHDVRDDWGDRTYDRQTDSKDYFIACCAYQVYNEFQRNLYEDYDVFPGDPTYAHTHIHTHTNLTLTHRDTSTTTPQLSASGVSDAHTHTQPHTHTDAPPLTGLTGLRSVNRTFHHHVIGDIGVIFIDQRGCKTFHCIEEDDKPHLGTPQWLAIRNALKIDGKGMFDQTKLLIVVTPVPIAYLANAPTMVLRRVIDDLYGTWAFNTHLRETAELLRLLFDWRAARAGERQIVLFGGDVHEGGYAQIQDTRYSTYVGLDRILQFNSSAIAQKMTSRIEHLGVALMRNLDDVLTQTFNMLHGKWTAARNYGVLWAWRDDACEAELAKRQTRHAHTNIAQKIKGSDKQSQVVPQKVKFACRLSCADHNRIWQQGPFYSDTRIRNWLGAWGSGLITSDYIDTAEMKYVKWQLGMFG